MLRQLVLAIFADEASADAAAEGLNRWAGQEAAATLIDTHQIQAMGVLVLDENGKLKTEKLGPRSMGTGAGIGLILAMLTPVGMAVGIIGGGILGARHHKSLIISKRRSRAPRSRAAGGQGRARGDDRQDERAGHLRRARLPRRSSRDP